MSTTFTGKESLGEIVIRFPKANEIFQKYGLDFCCGGDELLEHALDEHNLKDSSLLKELNDGYEEAQRLSVETVDWMNMPLHQLINHVVNTHHAYLQQNMPGISELTTTILRVHGAHHGETLAQVHRLFHHLKMDMEQHMIKEEEIVFPQIVDYEREPSLEKLKAAIHAVEELDKEHDDAGDDIKDIRKVTDQYKLPEDACGTFAKTYTKLQELEADMFQHIHLENNVLFVRLQNELKAYA